MPQNWKTYELRDLVNYVNGGSWAASCYGNTGIPVVRVSDVNKGTVDLTNCKYLRLEFEEKYKKHSLNYKDVIVCTVGSHPDQQSSVVGGIGIVDSNSTGAFLNQNAVLLRSENSNVLNQIWLGYFCKSSIVKNHIESEARGSANQVRIAITNLLNLNFDLPPLPEQTAIASILSTIDAKIENNLAINKTLEEMAMALYKEWFVDFGPFQDGKFVDSELGMIPEGWEVKSIGETIETVGGGTPRTKTLEYWEDGDVLWYSPTDLTREKSMFSSDSSKKITQLGLQKSSAKIFPPYSLLMSSRATIGLLTINTKQASTNQGFITMIPNDTLKIYQLYNWIKFNLDLIISKSNGSTFKEISKTNFRNLKIVVGQNIDNYEIQSKSIFERIESNINQNQTLTTLRDTLLPKLISGEVRLNEFANR